MKHINRKGTYSIKVDALKKYYGREELLPLWVADMDFETPDFVIDAIDSVDCKTHLISSCLMLSQKKNISVFSSMGAALRTDPTKVRIAPFHKITGDGLAKALRNRFRKSNTAIPKHLCVYSEELPDSKTAAKGSIMPVTCTFGMTLASLVINAVDAESIQSDA